MRTKTVWFWQRNVSTTNSKLSSSLCLMPRTTLETDAQLLEEPVQLSGERTKAATVGAALSEYARLRRKETLLAMSGRILKI